MSIRSIAFWTIHDVVLPKSSFSATDAPLLIENHLKRLLLELRAERDARGHSRLPYALATGSQHNEFPYEVRKGVLEIDYEIKRYCVIPVVRKRWCAQSRSG